MQILQHLKPLIESPKKSYVNVSDNACGAVSRIILKTPDILPLEHVVPLLVAALPLERDYAEYEVVMDVFMMLISKGRCEVNVSWFFNMIACEMKNFDGKTRVKVVAFLLAYSGNPNFKQILQSIGEPNAAIIMKVLTKE